MAERHCSSGRSLRLGKSMVEPDTFAATIDVACQVTVRRDSLDATFKQNSAIAAPGGTRSLRIKRRPARTPARDAGRHPDMH
jgi:hypothetical protein